METISHSTTAAHAAAHKVLTELGIARAAELIATGFAESDDEIPHGDRVVGEERARLASTLGREPTFLDLHPYGSAIRDAVQAVPRVVWLVNTGYGRVVVSARSEPGALRLASAVHGGSRGPTVERLPAEARWTTRGSVRGGCGHAHLTQREALECASSDSSGCGAQGGYSDRRVYLCPDGDISYRATRAPGLVVEVIS